jgi:hypothetical protein
MDPGPGATKIDKVVCVLVPLGDGRRRRKPLGDGNLVLKYKEDI